MHALRIMVNVPVAIIFRSENCSYREKINVQFLTRLLDTYQ